MASNILASVSVVLGAEIGEFRAKMAEARKELRGLVQFADGLKDVGESLTKFVTLPLLALGGAGIKMAGDLEKATASFTTLLGSADAAKKTLEELKAFAADTPFEFPEVQDAAKKLLAFNTPASELKETLRQLGDVSAGIDAPIGEIAELFGKARVQGRLFQEDINQLTGRGIPIIGELAKQFGVAESGVRKLVETGQVNFGNLQVAFAELTKEGGKFGGLMEKQSQTLPGLFSSLKDNIGQALAGIGTDISETLNLKGVIAAVSAFVKQAADAFAGLSPEIRKAVIVGAALAAALGPVLVVIGAIGTALPAIIAGFGVLGVTSVAALGPIAIAAAAVAAGAVIIFQNWDRLAPVFREAGASISAALNQIKEALGGVDTGNSLGDLLSELDFVDVLVSDIAVGVKALSDVFTGTVGAITNLFKGEFSAALADAQKALNGLIDPLANMLGFTKDAKFDSFFGLTDAIKSADTAALDGAASANELAGALTRAGGAAGGAVRPTAEQTEALKKQLLALQQLNAGYDNVGTRRILKQQETPEFKLNLPAASALPTTLLTLPGFDTSALAASSEAARQAYQLLTNSQKDAYQGTLDFNVRAGEAVGQFNQLLSSGLAEAAASMAAGIANVLSGAAPIGNLAGILLGTVGDILIQLGKLAITTGIVVEAIKKAFTNPATAVAAGLAAIAVGTLVKGAASNILSGGGGGGGGSASIGGAASTTRSGISPTQAPGLTNGPGGPNNVTHKIEFTLPGHLLTAALAYETERSGRLLPRR